MKGMMREERNRDTLMVMIEVQVHGCHMGEAKGNRATKNSKGSLLGIMAKKFVISCIMVDNV